MLFAVAVVVAAATAVPAVFILIVVVVVITITSAAAIASPVSLVQFSAHNINMSMCTFYRCTLYEYTYIILVAGVVVVVYFID